MSLALGHLEAHMVLLGTACTPVGRCLQFPVPNIKRKPHSNPSRAFPICTPMFPSNQRSPRVPTRASTRTSVYSPPQPLSCWGKHPVTTTSLPKRQVPCNDISSLIGYRLEVALHAICIEPRHNQRLKGTDSHSLSHIHSRKRLLSTCVRTFD